MSQTSNGQQSYVEPVPKIFSTHDYGDEIKLEDIQQPNEGLVCLKSPAAIDGRDLAVEDYENELFEITAAAAESATESRRSSITLWSWIWNRLTFSKTKHKRSSSSGSGSNKHNKKSKLKRKYSIQELHSESDVMTAMLAEPIKCPGCAYRLRRLRQRQRMKQIRQQKSFELIPQPQSTNIRNHPIITAAASKLIDRSSFDDMSTIEQSKINYHIREMESITDDQTHESDSSIYTIVIKLQDPKDFHSQNHRTGDTIKMLHRTHRSKCSSTSSSTIRQESISMIPMDNNDRQKQFDDNECQVYVDDEYYDSGNDDNLNGDDYFDDEYNGDNDTIINVNNDD
ncbi:hypothetical protein BLA29_007972, partial [Euroglyphus maynei]